MRRRAQRCRRDRGCKLCKTRDQRRRRAGVVEQNHGGFIPKPGRIALTPMITEKGRLYGDLTVACLADDHFMLFGSGVMQDAHSRFFAKTLPDGVTHENQTAEWHGIALSGPKSRELLSRITRDDVS